MTLTIELPDNVEAALKAQARSKGVSPMGYARRVLEEALASTMEENPYKSHQ